jgi:hypothetical protein
VEDQRGNDARHFIAVERDLPVAKVQPRHAVKDRRPLLGREIDRILTRLPTFLLGWVHERLTVPLVREQVAQILPGLIQLILVVAAGVFPIPHP